MVPEPNGSHAPMEARTMQPPTPKTEPPASTTGTTSQEEEIVSEHPNLALIHAYNDAWTKKDMATAATYLADDVTFDGPIQHLRSAPEFIPALERFASLVTGPMEIIAELADDDQVLMLYDIPTGPFGMVRSCDHFVIGDGKIRANVLVFDASPFRQAQAAR